MRYAVLNAKDSSDTPIEFEDGCRNDVTLLRRAATDVRRANKAKTKAENHVSHSDKCEQSG